MPSGEPPEEFHHFREILVGLAHAAIEAAAAHASPPVVRPKDYPAALRVPRAAFVTLYADRHLRGCIGSLTPRDSLAGEVSHNAFAAAARDPRFARVRLEEIAGLRVHIAVLDPPQALSFSNEEEVLAQLSPGVDGVVLEASGRRGTFLPSVWRSLPTPREFLRQLKLKAGLPEDYWDEDVRIARYRTHEIE